MRKWAGARERTRPFDHPDKDAELASELDDVFRRGPLCALNDVELHALTFGERLEAAALDGRMVDEAIFLAAFGGDETKAFGVVEPLHRAGRTHFDTPRECYCVVGV